MFEDSGFEIYETSARLNIERHEEIKGVDRHMLQMREVLNAIKDKYYEIIEHTADWTAEERHPRMQQWIDWLNKLTGPIRRQRVEEAMRELEDEEAAALTAAIAVEADGAGRKKRQRDEDDDE